MGITKREIKKTYLVEIAWEVVNQVGGIYTVIRSKVPTVTKKWGGNYCLLGPYMPHYASEFEPIPDPKDHFGKVVKKMQNEGLKLHYGHWLVSGRPRVILFDLGSVMHKLGEIKYFLWENHGISSPPDDHLFNDVLAFGEMVKIFLEYLANESGNNKKVRFYANLRE